MYSEDMNTKEMSRPSICPNALFEYAVRYAKRSEAAGRGTRHPTFRQAAHRFGATLDDVEQACEDFLGQGYMKPAVAFGMPGFGHADITPRGAWLVEAYRDE